MAIDEISLTWAQELEAWKSIPARSPVWDDLETFIEALREVAASKRSEREAGRSALRDALAELVGEFADDLEYFEADARPWNAESVEWDQAQSVAERVSQLYAELRARRALQETPATHYSETRRLREQISAQEDAIFGHLQALGSVFGGSAADTSDSPSRGLGGVSESSLRGSGGDQSVVVVRDEPAPLPSSSRDGAGQVDVIGPADSLHRAVDLEKGRFSPMTRAQEELILAEGAGVGIVFASGAHGFEHLPDAAGRFIAGKYESKGAYLTLPPTLTAESEIHDAISDFARTNSKAQQLVVCQPIALPTSGIASHISAAVSVLQEQNSAPLRIAFFVAAGGAWSWMTLPKEEREALTSRLNAIEALSPWTPEAVEDRLASQEKQHDPATVRRVMEATGGWYWCLDKLFDKCGKSADPRPAVDDLLKRLSPGGDLRDEMVMRLGVRPDTIPHKVLSLISAKGEVKRDGITAASIGCEASADDCSAAVEFLQTLSCVQVDQQTIRINPFLVRILDAAISLRAH